MKIEQQSNESQKNVRIVVRRTDKLPNDIYSDGKIHIGICEENHANEYGFEVGKVIEIEPLNNDFCAVMLAIEDNEAVKSAKPREIPSKTIQINKPDRNYTNEQIIKSVKGDLGSEHRNDTAAQDYFARLANRIEYYGLTDKDFADAHPYWKSYVSYIRSGDFPIPGINRNTHEFAVILDRAIEVLQDVKE